MAIYSADEVIDKFLYAKKPILVYRGYPDSKDYYSVGTGELIGQVYSYIYPDDRSIVWWQLYDPNSTATDHYVMHQTDAFDVQALKSQGAESEEEKQAAKDKENEGFEYYLKTYGVPFGILITLAGIAKAAVSRKKD